MVLDTFSQLSVDFVTSEMLGCGFLPVFIVSTFTLIRKVVLILVVHLASLNIDFGDLRFGEPVL